MAHQTKKRSERALWSVMMACFGALSLAGAEAAAQTHRSYHVQHDIGVDFRSVNAVDTPEVWMRYRCFAKARSGICRDSDREDFFMLPITTLTPVVRSADVGPPDTGHSGAHAFAEVHLAQHSAGQAIGTYSAYGWSDAVRDGCIFSKRSANALARSSCKVISRTRVPIATLPGGKVIYGGRWESERRIRGTTRPKITVDPIYVRVLNASGIPVQSHKVMEVKAEVVDGKALWNIVGDFRVLQGDGRQYHVVIDVGGSVVPILDRGRIEVRVDDGVITQSDAVGRFQHLRDGNPTNGELPNPGPSVFWSVQLPAVEINYTLGPASANDKVEVEMGAGGHDEADEALLCADLRPHYLSDIANGCVGFDTSIPQAPLSRLGYGVSDGSHHIMEFCETPPGAPTQLDLMEWPVFQPSEDSLPEPAAVYVRIWDGSPLEGGQVIAGNLTTNRLIDGDLLASGVFRVDANDPQNCTRPIRDLLVDMTWVPPLHPGRMYGIEFKVLGAPFTPGVQSPGAPYPQDPSLFRPAMDFDVASGQWSDLYDNSIGVQIPMFVWGEPAPCPGDANADGFINFGDVTTVLANFGGEGGGPGEGDADGDGDVDFSDITGVLANFLGDGMGCFGP